MGEESLMGKDVNFVFRMEKLAGSLKISVLTSAAGKDKLGSLVQSEPAGAHEHVEGEQVGRRAREGDGEASVGEHTGQPLSLAKILIPGADAVANAEGNTCGRVKASVQTARRGRRTWHV